MSALERFLALADAQTHEDRQICIAPAEYSAPPNLQAIPVSVFQLAAKPIRVQPMKAAANDAGNLKVSAKAAPADGVRRVEGAAYPSRWTPADHEKERQRRARQRPPRPTAKAKTKSTKLLSLIDPQALALSASLTT